jgi:fructokinase
MVLCFGECLWDVFARSSRPGGAPLNVAVHLRRLGREALPISSVGNDSAGDRLLNLIALERLPIHGITRHPGLPTGRVDIVVDADGEPRFDVRQPVAWDELSLTEQARQDAATAVAIVFGSLAQRSAHNRATLDELLAAMPSTALRVFDVNLRAPFFDLDRVGELARTSDVVKVNRLELSTLVGDDEVERGAHTLSKQLGGNADICVTMGAAGAALLHAGEWTKVEAVPVDVLDPVGSGDAFLAAIIHGMLSDESLETTLRSASLLAASVAARRGAW